MTIYERIKFLREKMNMSQQELALRVGYKDKSAVSKVERGERDINQQMVVKYAIALDTTPAYLMGWQEEKQTAPTEPELSAWIKGANPLSDYLLAHTVGTAERYAKGKAWSRCIWDVSAIAWLLNDNDKFMGSYLIPSLIPQYDHTYSTKPTRHLMRYVYSVSRDAIFTDLFTKLRNFK